MKFAVASLLWLCGVSNTIHAQSTSSSSLSSPAVYLQYNLLPAVIPNTISDHTGNLVSNRYVYLAGGCNATLGNLYNAPTDSFECSSVTDNFYRYDIETDTFETLPPMPIARYRHVAAAINNEQIWIFGGRDVPDNIIPQVDVFEIALNRWISIGNISEDLLSSDQGCFSNGNYAYVAGGYYQNYTAHNQVWRVDALASLSTKSLKYEVVAPLHQGRGDVAYAFDDKYAYVVGGFTNTNNFCSPLGDTERYTFATNTWEWLSPLNNPRSDLLVVQVNKTLFALGGERQLPNICNLTGTPPAPGQRTLAVAAVEMYDEAKQQWNVIASLPEHRFRFAGAVHNNNIYTFGGQSAFNASCNCFRTTNEVVQYIDVTTALTNVSTPMVSTSGAAASTSSTSGAASATASTTSLVYACVILSIVISVSTTMISSLI